MIMEIVAVINNKIELSIDRQPKQYTLKDTPFGKTASL